jgi:predicted esterase
MKGIETMKVDQHEPILRSVATTVHGRYLFRPVASSRKLLIGFHGYAETADKHLEDLLRIPGMESWNVAAVQALHPFYKSKATKVVASWMTRLDRELAIADNIAYIATVVRDLVAQLGGAPSALVYAGFSQGAHMAYRAALGSGTAASGLLILGSHLPRELLERAAADFPPVLIGWGSRDDLYTEEKLKEDASFLGQRATLLRMEAGHEWTDEFRVAAGEFLRQLAQSTEESS